MSIKRFANRFAFIFLAVINCLYPNLNGIFVQLGTSVMSGSQFVALAIGIACVAWPWCYVSKFVALCFADASRFWRHFASVAAVLLGLLGAADFPVT